MDEDDVSSPAWFEVNFLQWMRTMYLLPPGGIDKQFSAL
jgi:hypothetical protein